MSLQLDKLQLTRDGQPFLRPLDLHVAKGDIVAITGPSGCGKSTLLSAVCGSLSPVFTAQGCISIGGRDVSALPIEQRHIGILYQDPLLFPHLTVLENICFAGNHNDRRARLNNARQALEDVGLSAIAGRYPHEISGGQAARIGLLRTLQAKPRILLLDEPFSKLDSHTRQQFRDWVYSTIRQQGIPTLLVTHDNADIPAPGQILNLGDYTA